MSTLRIVTQFLDAGINYCFDNEGDLSSIHPVLARRLLLKLQKSMTLDAGKEVRFRLIDLFREQVAI